MEITKKSDAVDLVKFFGHKIIYIYWLYDKTHQSVHEGCKIFKCESCGKSFQVDFSEQTHRNYLFRSQRFQI